jgi:hypothetical protein
LIRSLIEKTSPASAMATMKEKLTRAGSQSAPTVNPSREQSIIRFPEANG